MLDWMSSFRSYQCIWGLRLVKKSTRRASKSLIFSRTLATRTSLHGSVQGSSNSYSQFPRTFTRKETLSIISTLRLGVSAPSWSLRPTMKCLLWSIQSFTWLAKRRARELERISQFINTLVLKTLLSILQPFATTQPELMQTFASKRTASASTTADTSAFRAFRRQKFWPCLPKTLTTWNETSLFHQEPSSRRWCSRRKTFSMTISTL